MQPEHRLTPMGEPGRPCAQQLERSGTIVHRNAVVLAAQGDPPERGDVQRIVALAQPRERPVIAHRHRQPPAQKIADCAARSASHIRRHVLAHLRPVASARLEERQVHQRRKERRIQFARPAKGGDCALFGALHSHRAAIGEQPLAELVPHLGPVGRHRRGMLPRRKLLGQRRRIGVL